MSKMREGSEENENGKSPEREVMSVGGREKEKGRSAAEWTTLIASVIVVLALAGMVMFDYFSRGTEPPRIEVTPLTLEVRQEEDRFYLPVEVANRGAETAATVDVEMTLTGTDGAEESASFTVNYLAGGETHQQTVIFGTDPSGGELEYVASFSTP